MTEPRPKGIRVYASVRTAHLERLPDLVPAHLVYGGTRYDFDSSLISDANRPQRLGRVATVRHLLSHPYDVVEINEPFMVSRWIDLWFQILAVRLRALLDGSSPLIVTYVLSLKDPSRDLAQRRFMPDRLAPWVAGRCLRSLVRRIDRIAFGTSAAYELMREVLPAEVLRQRSRVVPALASRCRCVAEESLLGDRAPTVLFVGAFVERKGVPELMDSWDRVVAERADATLTMIGTGALLAEVKDWAERRSSVTLVIDPPRSEIHTALCSARVVVLPSQRRGIWREQIGLPILEGLAHGARIVTTDESGLADWLDEHGHVVIPGRTSPDRLARGIIRSLDGGLSAGAVLRALPETDGRIAADRWMFTGDESAGFDPLQAEL